MRLLTRWIISLLIYFQAPLFAEHFLTYIIPCYNCAPWIQQAVDSIYEQHTLSCPFEVICTDDGSTDNTFALLSSLSLAHPNLHVFRHTQNRGGGAARNTCVAQAKGDLLFCLDADNVLVPNTVQQLIEHMDKTGCEAVAFGGVFYFVNNFERVGFFNYDTPHQKYELIDVLQRANSPPWSGNYLFTKASFLRAGGYPEVWSVDTFAFGLRQVLSKTAITYVPNTFYFHRHGIESYYVRESRSGRIQVHFFELLLSHEELFTPETVLLIRKHKNLAQSGRPFWDQIWFLQKKLIQLKVE